ncbi:restriction endonuclease [Leptospira sp. GIMC2001]|uniref:restriction endonuclease n=1 Tax=Leptospira sp. GIMC2001 TaxID=1513297 RepID=UPI00234A3670|nr:restriction endonuclease [Leptospira sp. GIMC2001]WCL48113.1 restriction endonuclease [Leptospira sp. GIMC2001]
MIFVILIGTGIIILGLVGTFVLQSQRDIYGKALSLAASGSFIDARALIRDKLDGSPGDTRSHLVLAKIYAMEGDSLNEANHLSKILSIGKFEKDMNPVQISNRIADIYYTKDLNEEAFFQYLTTVEMEPNNPTACIRLGFMALGQKDFKIADLFFTRLDPDTIKMPAFFVAKGVVNGCLEKGGERSIFEKAIKMEKTPVANFLFAISLAKENKFDKAIDIAEEIADQMDDEYIRYTLFQFIMCVSARMENYSQAMKYARLCMEMARLAGWDMETIESDIHFAMCSIYLGKYEEASEYLIEAESQRIHEPEVIALANIKYKLEHNQGNLAILRDEYDLEGEVQRLFSNIFPNSRYFELSGMRTTKPFNIRGMLDEGGKKIIKKLDQVGVDRFEKFLSLQGTNFKNACVRMILSMNYRVSREVANSDGDGVNYTGMSKENKEDRALFRFRRWRDSKISDVYLREMLNEMEAYEANQGYLIGNFDLTEAAKKFVTQHAERFFFINGNEFDILLGKILE